MIRNALEALTPIQAISRTTIAGRVTSIGASLFNRGVALRHHAASTAYKLFTHKEIKNINFPISTYFLISAVSFPVFVYGLAIIIGVLEEKHIKVRLLNPFHPIVLLTPAIPFYTTVSLFGYAYFKSLPS